jgi:hypothetical protein
LFDDFDKFAEAFFETSTLDYIDVLFCALNDVFFLSTASVVLAVEFLEMDAKECGASLT